MTHDALLEWARARRHSQVKGKPLFIARWGCYDGAVHLPSNLVGWLVEEIYSLGIKFQDVAARVDAPHKGSTVGEFISMLEKNHLKPVARALRHRFDDPPAASSQTTFRLT